MNHTRRSLPELLASLGLLVLAFGTSSVRADESKLPANADVGPNPTLVKPVKSAIPTVNVAPAEPWSDQQAPTAAAGLQVAAFAGGLDHPRWLHVLPNGDVLVAETNGPERPDDAKGIKGAAMKLFQKRAGAGPKSANRISLLRDTDGDGTADQRAVFLSGLNSPFGMALVGDQFYVANTDAVLVYPYKQGQTQLNAAEGKKLTDLPAGTINHHWTKSLIASPDGSKLYATVGSNSNVAENGIEAEEGRAAIWEIERATGNKRLYATGLRNPNGMAWMKTGSAQVLWTVANERDELGSDLVPDYLTSVRDGAFYGWPYSYYGPHLDDRVKPQRPDLVAKAVKPDYALGSHVAPLGMTAADGKLPGVLAAGKGEQGVFIGMHGSWNRRPLSGYKVVYLPFADGKPVGLPIDVLTGFIDKEGKARGRPVGVAMDTRGGLLVADDVGNVVWRVSPR
ncbi:sorbosone dehydrogenase [Pelomonas sp. Root1217]|uniref:PQQ-dependent sugar dehydrogenase n=1 Tax=Pelomonas sp. Root1217 TaxID=1736430 RepID=UPI00070DAF71|nr:sorbosone dehydrogenase [Pelomonas sp. Root1217]